jgi:hypothetical protein
VSCSQHEACPFRIKATSVVLGWYSREARVRTRVLRSKMFIFITEQSLSLVPAQEPTASPTAEPTPYPTAAPTDEPTATPTAEPSAYPTPAPSAVGTRLLSAVVIRGKKKEAKLHWAGLFGIHEVRGSPFG